MQTFIQLVFTGVQISAIYVLFSLGLTLIFGVMKIVNFAHGQFFTLTALVTFGGAYAVLPFVAAAAVNRFGWLLPEQMVAGLALGETTPGPLIMVNSFVGFVAGWGTLGGFVGGLAGATVATFATFAPSFLLIVVGAPLVHLVPQRGPLVLQRVPLEHGPRGRGLHDQQVGERGCKADAERGRLRARQARPQGQGGQLDDGRGGEGGKVEGEQFGLELAKGCRREKSGRRVGHGGAAPNRPILSPLATPTHSAAASS